VAATSLLPPYRLQGQDQSAAGNADAPAAPRPTGEATIRRPAKRTANIHWQRVPLREAIGRLRDLFEDTVFVDRRVDPTTRVSLDIVAGSAEEVVAALANRKDLGIARLGSLVYLGPTASADQLRTIAAARSQDASRLPAGERRAISERRPIAWERLAEPRRLIELAAQERGWRIANADAVPHDLWSSGRLPALSLSDGLTILLIGFDLTFELRPQDQSIEIVPLKPQPKASGAHSVAKQSGPSTKASKPKQGGQQQYTLRVQEQPVGAVLQALGKRLNWTIQIDEEGIRKAGKSLDTRVSFSVNKADRDQLLESLLKPAGLDYQADGDRVRVIAERYNEK
jgi:hypothetical protein